MTDFPEIHRDREFFDGEVGDTLNVWWVKGHDIDPDEFIHAVIEDCLEWDGSVPRIDPDDKPIEMWQQNVSVGDGVEYRRSTERGEGSRHSPVFPVTVLDLERRTGRGGRKCMVTGCGEPWSACVPLRMMTTAAQIDGDPDAYMAVEVTLCSSHRHLMADPYYRTLVVPVGATAVVPTPEPEVVDETLRPICLTCMSKGVKGVWNADMDPAICSACGGEQTP